MVICTLTQSLSLSSDSLGWGVSPVEECQGLGRSEPLHFLNNRFAITVWIAFLAAIRPWLLRLRSYMIASQVRANPENDGLGIPNVAKKIKFFDNCLWYGRGQMRHLNIVNIIWYH